MCMSFPLGNPGAILHHSTRPSHPPPWILTSWLFTVEAFFPNHTSFTDCLMQHSWNFKACDFGVHGNCSMPYEPHHHYRNLPVDVGLCGLQWLLRSRLYACYFSFGKKRKVSTLHFLGCVPQFSVLMWFCGFLWQLCSAKPCKTMQNLPSPATRTRGMRLNSAHRWTALLHLGDHSDADASDDGLGTSMQRQHCVTCRKTGPAASPDSVGLV